MLYSLTSLIENGNWEEARFLADSLFHDGEDSDTFWILNAAIYLEENDPEAEYACISRGLQKNPANYELYLMLGNYYLQTNPSQACLCYEQALFYCDDEKDEAVITDAMHTVKGSIHPVSIIISSENNEPALQKCIESIHATVPKQAYEIIVADFQSDTAGFIRSRNECIKASAPHNDIFLMFSDTLLPPNALFWLRMSLYERQTVGAAGPTTNDGDLRQVTGHPCDDSDYLSLAEKIHVPSRSPYENKIYLSSFALLIKREALDEAGLFSTRYDNLYLSDYDFGLAVTTAGYELLLCHNAFIFFYNQFCRLPCLPGQNQHFYEKWGFHITYYYDARNTFINLITSDQQESFSVLEIGCGCGLTLSKIKYRYPNAAVHGIELDKSAAKAGKYMADILVGNIEDTEIPFEPNTFDYILFGDVLEHLHRPDEILVKMKKYLKPTGRLIASIPNLMHISVILKLLAGHFTYEDSGLLDRTHIHFFTKYEIMDMFEQCGYRIAEMHGSLYTDDLTQAAKESAELLYQLPFVEDREQFETFHYYVAAEPI